MSRMLAILSVTGLVLCAAFLGAAFWIGGDDIFRNPGAMKGIKPLIDMATRKEWRWEGGDTLALNAPVNVRYQPKGPPGISVTGPAELMKNVRVGEGRIAAEAPARQSARKLEAVVSGVPIRKFVVNGGENLDLGQVDQPVLDLHLNGVGTVRGEGQVDALNLVIAGPGNADLGKLTVRQEAKVSILGNGNASLGPKGDLRVFIAGSGRLSLTSHPKDINRTIVGNGEVVLPPHGAHPAPPRPPSAPVPPPSGEHPAPPLVDVQVQPNTQMIANPGKGEFIVQGSREANFGRIERDSAKFSVLSSGSATAEGQVNDLSVQVMGSGRADLGRLSARDAAVTVAGSGEAIIAASGTAKITILGSGRVRLVTRPERIERNILGSGRIIEAY